MGRIDRLLCIEIVCYVLQEIVGKILLDARRVQKPGFYEDFSLLNAKFS